MPGKILLLFVAYACTTSLSNAMQMEDILSKLPINSGNLHSNRTVLESWQNFEKTIKGVTNSVVKMALPTIMESTANMNLSTECMRNSMLLINGIKNIKPWAIRFLDSSAKIMDGILVGSLSSFGEYDECVNTIVRSTKLRDKGKMLFRGQYCTIELTPPLPPKEDFYKLDEVLNELKNFSERDTVIAEAAKYAHFFHFLTLRLGICTPSGCSLGDIDKIAKLLGNVLSLRASAARCELKQENEYSPVIIAVITAFSIAGFLMLIGSLIDIYAYYRKVIFKNKTIRVLVAFSLLTNFRKFSNTETASDTLSCLNGIRFLCMSWVILGHTYLNVNFQIFLGLEKVRAYARDFAFQAVINASVAVDTFFCIGGLLVGYLTIKLVRNQGHKFSAGLYIFHRLWRILPVYCYVIMFMFLGNFLGSGPIWHDTTHKYIKACWDNWWTNIIFINNFYDAEHMCIPQSWYMASDFQLYIGLLLIILPMIRWPKAGIILSVFTIIASVVYSGLGTYINNYPPTMLFAHPDPEQRVSYWARFYFRPFVHAGPYCIGFLAGYLLATRPNLKIPPFVQVLGWSLAFIFNFSVLYGVVEWNRGVEPAFWSSMLYASFNRVAWTLGVAWIIVCCATGHGGVINYILSWKAFVPLGRLTYVAYLIHPIVQIAAVGNVRTQIQPDHFIAVWFYFGHLCITYMTAFAGSMLIEAPFMALEKIIFPPKKKAETNCVVKQNGILNGSLKTEKNGDIASIVPKTDEESGGIDNKCVVYRL